MKYIKQFSIIILISLIGETLAQVLPFTIPASVYGLFVMLLALCLKIIKPMHVKETSDFLMDVMPIMFVPASVGLMVSWGMLKEILVPVLIVSVLGTLVVMIVSGKTVDVLMKLSGGDTVMTDGITVDGIDITNHSESVMEKNIEKHTDHGEYVMEKNIEKDTEHRGRATEEDTDNE